MVSPRKPSEQAFFIIGLNGSRGGQVSELAFALLKRGFNYSGCHIDGMEWYGMEAADWVGLYLLVVADEVE